jgi:starch phosphorylase
MPIANATNQQLYTALFELVQQRLAQTPKLTGPRKVYYISSEFLVGRMLASNLINLDLYRAVQELLANHGKDLAVIEEIEPEPSLGNGGLGRLAACFLDSIASLNIPACGVSLNYHFGLFKQRFINHLQHEEPNPWLSQPSWLHPTPTQFKVDFNGLTVTSRLYELDAVGAKHGLNKLCLFDIESVDETIVTSGIDFDKSAIAKNLTLFLYPDDSDRAGHLLRIYQQYFMVSNAVQLIIAEVMAQGYPLTKLHQHVVIQINDTHPTMVIPELIRVLELHGISRKQAIEIVKQTVAYTNHTILAEALEKWPLEYLREVVPHLVTIIEDLDQQVRREHTDPELFIIDNEQRVHMARIDLHYCFSVNGVAQLHTEILKHSELKVFNDLYPNKFNNKTNGITFRRWLNLANPELTNYLSDLIGDEFKTEANNLAKLCTYQDDANVVQQLARIKQLKKNQFAQFSQAQYGVTLNPSSIFDVQIKRIHEYKRQQMNALYIIHKYLEVKAGKLPPRPITFIFGGKAAPAYIVAKQVIHLILCLQQLINQDQEVNTHLQVLFVENYNVSVAEKLIPAADISEQISLASKEASGTGNMKLMLNGAVTLGTLDGANVEIANLVGADNIYTFGKDSAMIIELYRTHGYQARDYYNSIAIIKRAVDFIVSDELLAIGNQQHLTAIHHELINKDWFMTLIDLVEYIAVKERMLADFENSRAWDKKRLINIAQAGFFSSDRTIAEYNRDIWKIV